MSRWQALNRRDGKSFRVIIFIAWRKMRVLNCRFGVEYKKLELK